MKVVIIDDEELARHALKSMLMEVAPYAEVLEAVGSVADGVKAIRRHLPDIVFCDVEMPVLNGLQLLDFFNPEEVSFELIFATSFSQYAVQAFQLSAIDYLLKPLDKELLLKAVEKVERKQNSYRRERYETLKQNAVGKEFSKIALPLNNEVVFVATGDILYLKADNVYTEVFLADGKRLVVSKPIKDFERMLEGQYFFRTHRTYIVNLQRIKAYTKSDGGFIVMENKDIVSLARERKEAFQKSWQGIKI
jgi:two-component system LytT family response regulator